MAASDERFPSKFLNIKLDREWTKAVVLHVKQCGSQLEFLRSEQDDWASTDFYKCQGCDKVLLKQGDEMPDDEETRRMIQRTILKKAALGIPIDNVHERIIVTSASDEEIASTLKDPPRTKTMDDELDKEWTRTVAEHVIQCRSDIDFETADRNGFELIDHYHCQKCGERLSKRAGRDRDTGDGALRVDINHRTVKTLAMESSPMTVLQLYHFYCMSSIVSPPLQEIHGLVAAFKEQQEEYKFE